MPDQNVTITRLRPWDLLEAKNKYGDLTLTAAIAAMQDDDNRAYTCPKCIPNEIELDPQPTGKITVTLSDQSQVPVICDICEGYLKTSVQYVPDENNPGNYIPFVEEPEVQEPGN